MPPHENSSINNIQLSEEEKTTRIAGLKKLIKENENLKGLQNDDAYLRRFLYSTDFDVAAAYDKMKTFYELLLEFPDWFTRDSPIDRKSIIEQDTRILTSSEDCEGRPIYIVKLGNVDVNKLDILDCVAVDDIMMESIMDDPRIRNGLSVIIDVSNYSWKLMKWLTPFNLKTALKKLESHPIKCYRFHVVKSSILVNAAIKIIWPFLNDNFKEMVKFHFNNMDSLHEHIDPSVLPPEYGGTVKWEKEKFHQAVFEKNNEIVESFKLRRSEFLF